ncbi:MAG: DUF559 domain-containing protein [Solirubrobacterales bacterium]
MERRLAALARRQFGVVARDQLIGIGFTRSSIAHRLRCDRLRPVHPAVYAVGSQPLIARGRWFAALLACRPSPALSHLSSAAAQELARERGTVHISVPGRPPARSLSGVVVHRPRRLHPDDLTTVGGLPVTTVPRTLLDLAETEPYERVQSIAEEAERRELLDLRAIRDCMDRNPGRRGHAPLARLLDEYLSAAGSHEGIEMEFIRFLADYGLPEPQRNVLVSGLVVDFWWPDARLVAELDSRAFHAHWSQAERDRERDARLLREGIHTLRVTARRLRRDRPGLAADIASRFRPL